MILTLENLKDYADEEGDCLIWRGATNKRGSPIATIGKRRGVYVRRHIFTELLGKKIRKGRVMTSLCVNPRCIAPECLTTKTKGEILARTYAIGARSRAAARQSWSVGLRKAQNVKLDREKAAQIRASQEPTNDLAKQYGVDPQTIRNVRAFRCWNDVMNGASVFSWRP